jgi:hypothetical protein
MTRCPYCAEDVSEDDVRCPHCGSTLPTAGDGRPREASSTPSAGGWGSASAGAWGGSGGPGGAWPEGTATTAPATTPEPSPGSGGVVQFSHSGQRYLLGYDSTHFGIWDRGAPGSPVERFPRSDDGWSRAWSRYASLEPDSQPVHAATGYGYGSGPVPYGAPPQAGYGPPGGPVPGYGGPGQPWQQGPPVYYVPQQTRTNGLAVASLVLGIVGLILAGFFAIVPALALILGLVALSQIRTATPGTLAGKGLAIAGVALGSVGIVLFVIIIVVATNDPTSGF